MKRQPIFDPDAAAPKKSGIYGLPFTPDEAKVVIIPVLYEATTSYGGGTSRGPAAIFAASKQVDLFDHETGRPYEAGIAMLDIPRESGSSVSIFAKWRRAQPSGTPTSARDCCIR